MSKAKRKNITKTKSKAPRREGLDLIDATHTRKVAREPNLKRELKLLRHSNDVPALAAMYDAYMSAADAILGIEMLRGEWNWLLLKALTVAEQLARMQPSDETDQEMFVQTLFNSALGMGRGIDGANSVLRAAMAVGTAK